MYYLLLYDVWLQNGDQEHHLALISINALERTPFFNDKTSDVCLGL